MAVIGVELSPDAISVLHGFHVEVLVARDTPQRRHCSHPEVVGIGSDDVKGLLECDFNLESHTVKLYDLQSCEGAIC